MTLKDILKKKNDVYSFFTEKDCLNAISDKDNKYSLLLCKIQTPEICKIACEKSGTTIKVCKRTNS